MSWRVSLLSVALLVVTVACAQPRPERTPLPDLPDRIEFPAVTTTSTDPVPDDGGCYVVQAVGAVVTTTQAGFDAVEVLEEGDVITSFDGTTIIGRASLIAAVTGRRPGESVVLEFSRDGVAQEATVRLGPDPDDATVGRIGVGLSTAIEGVAVGDLDTAAPAGETHNVVVGNRLLQVDLRDGVWFGPGIPAPQSSIVDVDGRIYVADPGGLPLLASVDGGGPIPVPTDGRPLLRALSNMGTRLLLSVQDGAGFRIIAVDVGAEAPAWSWAPVDALGTVAEPLIAFASPTGEYAVVSLTQDDTRVATLFDVGGRMIAGFGTGRELVPTAGVFAGWFDATHVAYITATASTVSVSTLDVTDLTSSVIAELAADEELRQVWAAGDGRHIATVSQPDTILHDVESETNHLLSRNCELGFIGGPSL